MKRIQFNTGRLYQKDGQRIVAVEDDEGRIFFEDHSRMIWGMLTQHPLFTEQHILRHYDDGLYSTVVDIPTPNIEILLRLDAYHDDPDYRYEVEWALKYPLMYAMPGTRHGNHIRLQDNDDLHLHMCVVDINTGKIWHATKVNQ